MSENKNTIKGLELVVTVRQRENNETGEVFNTYKVSTADGKIYDLRFTKDVPEEMRPIVSSLVYVMPEDYNVQKFAKEGGRLRFPIVWVRDILSVQPLETEKLNFKEVEIGINGEDEDDPFEEKENEEVKE